MAMRCHVDVDATTQLTHLEAVLQAHAKWEQWLEIELVAFPQAGVVSCPGTAQVLDQAMRAGAQVVGGIDPTTFDGDPDRQLDVVFDLAERHAAKVDVHLHEPGEICMADLQRIAARTEALGMQGVWPSAMPMAWGIWTMPHCSVLRRCWPVRALPS